MSLPLLTCKHLSDAARAEFRSRSCHGEVRTRRGNRRRGCDMCARNLISFCDPCGSGSSSSFATSATMRATCSRGIRCKSLFVDARHSSSKEAIALELGNKLLVRNGWLSAALSYDCQIFQIFQQFFIVGNRKHNGCAFAALISDVLYRIAHDSMITVADCGLKRRCRGQGGLNSLPATGAVLGNIDDAGGGKQTKPFLSHYANISGKQERRKAFQV
jgi:hypothetical protein